MNRTEIKLRAATTSQYAQISAHTSRICSDPAHEIELDTVTSSLRCCIQASKVYAFVKFKAAIESGRCFVRNAELPAPTRPDRTAIRHIGQRSS
jgi:hypothetical protein